MRPGRPLGRAFDSAAVTARRVERRDGCFQQDVLIVEHPSFYCLLPCGLLCEVMSRYFESAQAFEERAKQISLEEALPALQE